MRKQHYDYVPLILEWAENKGILENGDLEVQLNKSTEECCELQGAIIKYEKGNLEQLEEIKDAIGDVYVTLVISFELANKLLNTHLYFKTIKPLYDHTLITSYRTYVDKFKELDLSLYKEFMKENNSQLDLIIIRYVEYLNMVAERYNLTLSECIEFAYNTISKRTGKMIDGSFVKDE